MVEVHGDFGAELDLFRKVADGRAGGYVSVKGRFSGLGGMRFTPEDASQIAACAVNVWLDGRNARVANATVTTSSETLQACGRVGPDPSTPKLFVGSRKRLGSGGALIEGAAAGTRTKWVLVCQCWKHPKCEAAVGVHGGLALPIVVIVELG